MLLSIHTSIPVESLAPEFCKRAIFEDGSSGYTSFSRVIEGPNGPISILFQTQFEFLGEYGFTQKIPDALISFTTMIRRVDLDPKETLRQSAMAVSLDDLKPDYFPVMNASGDDFLPLNGETLMENSSHAYAAIERALSKSAKAVR